MLRHGFRALVVACSLLALIAYLAAAVPAALGERPADPVEAAVLDQANRLLDHRPAYAVAGPAPEVALMPGFAGTVALLVGVDDAKLWLVRQVALVAALFLAFLVAAMVHFESGGWTLPLAVASLSLVGPALLGPAPGTARPETIAVLFVVLGFGALRFTRGLLGAIAGALLLALAYAFHAQAVWFVGAAALSLAAEDRRRFSAFALAAGLVVGGGTLVASRAFGPWFNFAAFDEPLRALVAGGGGALAFTTEHLLGRLGLCTLVVLLSCAISTQPWNERRGTWMWLGAASLLAGLGAGATSGSTLLPNVVAVILVGAVALDLVSRHLADSFGTGGHEGESVLYAGLLVQFVALGAAAPAAPWVAATVATLARG
jgi:hypothetical protein